MIVKVKIILLLMLYSINILAKQEIQVLDGDSDIGIKSNVFESLGSKKVTKGVTNEKGIFVLQESCENGKIIEAKPVSPIYYKGTVDCSHDQEKLVIKVIKIAYVANLNHNAKFLAASGDNGSAALLYTEVAARLHNIDADESKIARKQAIKLFSAAIDTPKDVSVLSVDYLRNSEVMSNEFKSYLIDYQKEAGIPETGKIDFNTLSTKANTTIGKALYDKFK